MPIAAILDFIPKWLIIALLAVASATSCKFKYDKDGLTLEVEKHATKIAQLEADIFKGNADAEAQKAQFEYAARKAEQDRAAREKTLVADAAAANSALRGLRIAVQQASSGYGLQASKVAIAPELDTADSFGKLFLESVSRYSDLAAACDRHVSDLKTVIEAFPK